MTLVAAEGMWIVRNARDVLTVGKPEVKRYFEAAAAFDEDILCGTFPGLEQRGRRMRP